VYVYHFLILCIPDPYPIMGGGGKPYPRCMTSNPYNCDNLGCKYTTNQRNNFFYT